MDIKELFDIKARRHPWETARLKAIQRVLRPVMREGINVLDIGCGDGFISHGLAQHLHIKKITAVDINLTDELLSELNSFTDYIKYSRNMPLHTDFDLILLLDVIEHVESDTIFLKELVSNYLCGTGIIMLTAPAFSFLYGRHDVALGHYRRYSLDDLISVANASGLDVVSSGYFFTSLILPKLLMYKLTKVGDEVKGVGRWDKNRCITAIMVMLFNIENSLLFLFSRMGIKIPGLTGWALCKKK